MLVIERAALFDDTITQIEHHTHARYASAQYETQIPVQKQVVFTVPSESFLYIEDKLIYKTGTTGDLNVKLGNNAITFRFEKIRY